MRVQADSHRLQADILLLLPTMLGGKLRAGSSKVSRFSLPSAELPFCEPWLFLFPLHMLSGALRQHWEVTLYTLKRKMA